MRKIVLLCNAGMSTSMLVTKIRNEAKAANYEIEINAYPVVEVQNVAENADIVLLGPQVRFQLNKVKNLVTCPVEVIDMSAYGMMDGKAVLNHVKKVLGD